MSQHDLDIANQTASATRSDINDALVALGSTNSGASAPSTTYANMLWYDTTANTLKMRAEADDAWISIGYFDQSADAFRILDDTQVVNTSGTQTGLIGDQTYGAWTAGTGATESLVSPAKVKAAVLASAPSSGISFLSVQSPTSGTAVDFTGIPSTATEIYVYFINNDTSGYYRVQLIVGGVPITFGYESASGTSGAESTATDGFFIYNTGLSTSGIMNIHKPATGTWVESHSVKRGGADASGGGHILSVGTVGGIRVFNTGVFQSGSLCVGYR